MIYVVIGTKAQLIKMAPIMVELQKRGIRYNFIFTGQHLETVHKLRENFGIDHPSHTLYHGKDVTSLLQVVPWILTTLYMVLVNKRTLFEGRGGNDIVLVHGDTFSTVLGAIIGRLFHKKVGHVESGLRSYHIFHPFPEELNRLLTFTLSTVYFCESDEAVGNLRRFKGDKINTRYNTMYDALTLALDRSRDVSVDIPDEPYCIVSIHRFENIFLKPRLRQIIADVNDISKKIKTIFILHKPTKERLQNNGYMKDFSERVELRERYDFLQFQKILASCEFMVTDGGGNQEECKFLGKPCLLMRKTTERPADLGKNIVLSSYDKKKIDDFVDNYHRYESEPLHVDSPSKKIVDYLVANHYTSH